MITVELARALLDGRGAVAAGGRRPVRHRRRAAHRARSSGSATSPSRCTPTAASHCSASTARRSGRSTPSPSTRRSGCPARTSCASSSGTASRRVRRTEDGLGGLVCRRAGLRAHRHRRRPRVRLRPGPAHPLTPGVSARPRRGGRADGSPASSRPQCHEAGGGDAPVRDQRLRLVPKTERVISRPSTVPAERSIDLKALDFTTDSTTPGSAAAGARPARPRPLGGRGVLGRLLLGGEALLLRRRGGRRAHLGVLGLDAPRPSPPRSARPPPCRASRTPTRARASVAYFGGERRRRDGLGEQRLGRRRHERLRRAHPGPGHGGRRALLGQHVMTASPVPSWVSSSSRS